MKNLIVTADDFGAAEAVNDAVQRCHENGILTAASLMVSGAAAHDAVARARQMPSLRVGLHLVLVEGRPILPADAVPDLQRGQDSPLCQQMTKPLGERRPVTTPPANNRGKSAPPRAHR